MGVGYSFSIGKDFNGRVGVERWMYQEDGGKNDVGILSFNYGGLPVDLGLGLTKLLDDEGLQITGNVSKNVGIGTLGGFNLSITPSASFTVTDKYFGVSGHTNDIYGLTLSFDEI